MQTLVIGDIHGCYVELQALLEKADLSDDDLIIGLGDIVDRGPETPQVLDFFRNTPKTRALMGNHERKHVRAARGEIKLAISQQISRQQLGDGYPEAVLWMESMPLFIELPEALLVHGYLELGVPLEEQKPTVLCGTMGGEKILRERYDRPWYELYKGEKPIIVGHHNYTDTDQPFVHRDKIFGLDTSCVNGKSLTGLLLPSFRIVSVPSRGNLWAQIRRSYRRSGSAVRPKAIISWSDEDNVALAQLIEKARQANKNLLDKIRSAQGFSELSPRKQAKLYAAEAGKGPFATLMQLARLGKLDPESARRLLKNPDVVYEILSDTH
jgi:serine/threonine protein phosphatase 1